MQEAEFYTLPFFVGMVLLASQIIVCRTATGGLRLYYLLRGYTAFLRTVSALPQLVEHP